MVATVDFSVRGGGNFVWKEEADLTELVPGERYQLPEEAVIASLVVMRNGQVLSRNTDNGYAVLSSTVFELKIAKRTSEEYIQAGYQPS